MEVAGGAVPYATGCLPPSPHHGFVAVSAARRLQAWAWISLPLGAHWSSDHLGAGKCRPRQIRRLSITNRKHRPLLRLCPGFGGTFRSTYFIILAVLVVYQLAAVEPDEVVLRINDVLARVVDAVVASTSRSLEDLVLVVFAGGVQGAG